MTYFQDLSRYSYSNFRAYPSWEDLWNVGWLDRSESFEKGVVEPELTTKLLLLCKCPLNMYRGWHGCQFCAEYPVKVGDSDGEFCLGDGEIRVWAKGGKTYAAPNLIYHYVAVHKYQPPDEFLNALREMELPYPRVLQAMETIDQFRNSRRSLQLLPMSLTWIAGRENLPLPAELREALAQAAHDLVKAESSDRVEGLIRNLELLLSRYHSAPE